MALNLSETVGTQQNLASFEEKKPEGSTLSSNKKKCVRQIKMLRRFLSFLCQLLINELLLFHILFSAEIKSKKAEMEKLGMQRKLFTNVKLNSYLAMNFQKKKLNENKMSFILFPSLHIQVLCKSFLAGQEAET